MPLLLGEQSRNWGIRVLGAAWVPHVSTVRVMAQPPAEPLGHPALPPSIAVPYIPSVYGLLPGFLCSYSGFGLAQTPTLASKPTSNPSLLRKDGLF